MAQQAVEHVDRLWEDERERSTALQQALREQLEAARKELSEVPLLREQFQMAPQVTAQAALRLERWQHAPQVPSSNALRLERWQQRQKQNH